MRAEIVTIGAELTSGAIVNTNAAELARRLAELGMTCRRQITVGDERTDLAAVLAEALRRCDLLIMTGGLGPTFDDVTMAVLAQATGRALTLRPQVAAQIRRFYTRRHRRLQRAALRQALLPEGGEPLPNPLGTAPGLWLELPHPIVIALPGVPREMRAIFEHSVLPRLRRLGEGLAVESRTLRTAGIVELSIEAVLKRLRVWSPTGRAPGPLCPSLPGDIPSEGQRPKAVARVEGPPIVQVGLYPHLRTVDVRLTAAARSRAEARRAVARLEAVLRRQLGETVYGSDGDTLEGVVGPLLIRRGKTLAVAESCTGGLVSDRITNVPGSSRYFLGAVVSYHNNVKQRQLNVPSRVLSRFGAVSAHTARQMAEGARRLTGAGVGLAVTGIAGPSGGTIEKPVGLVYFAIADHRRTLTRRVQFFGDRLSIKAQAAQAALDWLRLFLLRASSRRSPLARGG